MNPIQATTSADISSAHPDGLSGGFAARVSSWNQRHPVLAMVLVSLVAVVINGYPILFCGKSYVSPMSSETLVYNWWPPLPGMAQWPARTPEILHKTHGSDVFAMMWWGVPVGFVESRSLLEHGELPLWNRYNHAGETLIGQAVSMLGDPLQIFVILGHGSAWAWDLKFLTAKFVFCFGFSLLIFRLLKNQVLALVYAALAAYCGAFFFINNHMVFFVFSYAPWILLATLEWLEGPPRQRFGWGLIWLVANFASFNAGHVEVAVALIGGLNLAAMISILPGCRDRLSVVKVLGRLAVGTLLFLGLSAPVWMSFLASLQGSLTAHNSITVEHLPLTSLVGVFDDLFYLLLHPDVATAPSSSLLIMAGVGLSLMRWRQLKNERFYWVNLGAIVWWAGCVFGVVPTAILEAVPLLNRVGHLGTDFSFLLVLHLTVQSAYGFLSLTRVHKATDLVFDLACIAGGFAAVVWLFFSGNTHQPVIPWNYFICAAAGALGTPLLFVYLNTRHRPARLLGWAGILVLGFIPNFRFGLYHAGSDDLLMLPGPRVVLNSPSPAVDKIKADHSGPFRVVSIPWEFMGNYAAVYELEDIRSCSPLSNGEFVDLIRQFPGMELSSFWMISVVDPVKAQPLLSLLNVKYLLARPGKDSGAKPGYRLVGQSDFGVLENQTVWPRAFFANQVLSVDSIPAFIQQLELNGQKPFAALNPQALLEHPRVQALVSTNPATITPATHYILTPNATEFDIHAATAGIVCLTENQANDFSATANGEPKEVLTVNRAFKGIFLDQPGDYHIQFIYRPQHWRLACACFWISLGAVLLLALMNFICFKRSAKMAAAP